MAYHSTKYKAKKTTVDGITFDSKKEASYYCVLRDMQERGEIIGLELQPSFLLIPSQYGEVYGKRKCLFRAVHYKADFRYFDCTTKKVIVVDVKGFKTPVYRLKKALLYHKHGIMITEV